MNKRHESATGNTCYPLCFRNVATCFRKISVCGNLAFRPVSAFAVSFHFTRSDARVKFDSGVIFRTDHKSLLRIAANEIASFCIDNRLRQMALVGKGRLSLKEFEIKLKGLSVVICFVII